MPSKRIAVVDNDAPFRAALAHFLRAVGYEVDCHASAESFLASGGLSRADCLVLDVRMPGMSGLDLLRHLDRVGAGIPVVLITGDAGSGLPIEPRSTRTVEILEKPFGDDALLDVIERALRVASR